MKKRAFLVLWIVTLVACKESINNSQTEVTENIVNPSNKVLLSSDIVWEKLNPARGDQSPQAGTIWGDRKGEVPTGFLAKFVDGFSSPPHIHNVTYRAVVIKGLVHNDDPNAENMWMSPGSFWTQPVGESHITSAKGDENMALVEINKGPYLVKPISEAFDNGEIPINIDASNVVWLNNNETNWIAKDCDAEISFLLETDQFRSLFVKLPVDFSGVIKTNGEILHAVVINGELNYQLPQNNETKILDVGSYFGATDKAIHKITNNSKDVTLIYIRTNGDLFVSNTKI